MRVLPWVQPAAILWGDRVYHQQRSKTHPATRAEAAGERQSVCTFSPNLKVLLLCFLKAAHVLTEKTGLTLTPTLPFTQEEWLLS